MDQKSFFEPDGSSGRFLATELTRGPWSRLHQHGGPPAALMARAVERARSDRSLAIVRFTVEFLRPVPIGEVRLEVETLKRGRTVERYAARLWSGSDLVLTAVALCLRERPETVGPPVSPPPPPPPDTGRRFQFPFFPDPVGYHEAVEVRYVRGRWGQPEVTCWLRQHCSLVLHEEPTPLQRTLVAADAGHGVAVPVELANYSFVNADLSVHLARPLQGEWVGMQSASVAEPSGIGLCQTQLWDGHGPVGRAAQSLVVRARKGLALDT
ncbi:MAG: thioesterase family protein [Acidobacteriota bacterium]|nr:thioesterase family protein [Acidobacteriota bacterium]